MAARVSPIPVAVFGKDPKMAKSVSEKLLPDYEVVHVCHDLETALAEFPPLFTGHYTLAELPRPASGLGTHADPRVIGFKIPRAVFFGGKVTDAEYNAIAHCVKKTRDSAALDVPPKRKPQPPTATTFTNPGPSTKPNKSSFPSATNPPSASADPEKRELHFSLYGSVDAHIDGSSSSSSSSAAADPESPPPYNNGLQVHFVKVQKRDVLAAGTMPPPSAEQIAKIFRKKMGAALERERQEKQLSL